MLMLSLRFRLLGLLTHPYVILFSHFAFVIWEFVGIFLDGLGMFALR